MGRILEEWADLTAVMQMLQNVNALPPVDVGAVLAAIDRKKRKLDEFLNYSRELGRLDD